LEVAVGDEVTFSKTVSEADVYGFAGISGDFYAAHVDAEFMARSQFGQRIAHGALLVGFMSAASTALIHKLKAAGDDTVPVSLGYDRLRFVAPVFFGDTVTVRYKVESVDVERRRSVAKIEVGKQGGEVVAVGEHIMKWLVAPGA
jgi:acyl dehydratase